MKIRWGGRVFYFAMTDLGVEDLYGCTVASLLYFGKIYIEQTLRLDLGICPQYSN
jgi:hypothetical protein